MIKIAICEDDLLFAKFEEKVLFERYGDEIDRINIFTDVDSFFSGNFQEYDVLLLDIKLGTQNGYEIAKRLNENESTCFVIVVTSYENTARFGYEFNVFRFIRKVDFEVDIDKAFTAILNQIYKKRKTILLKYKGASYHFRYSQIVYVVSMNNYIIIKTKKNKDYKFRILLKVIRKSLEDNGLVRINRGVMLNCEYLDYIDKKKMQVFLTNGEHIGVSEAGINNINKSIIGAD